MTIRGRVLLCFSVLLAFMPLVAGDDIDKVRAAARANPAPPRVSALKTPRLMAATPATEFQTYDYEATGELNVTKGAVQRGIS